MVKTLGLFFSDNGNVSLCCRNDTVILTVVVGWVRSRPEYFP